jgi:hypothetical protein
MLNLLLSQAERGSCSCRRIDWSARRWPILRAIWMPSPRAMKCPPAPGRYSRRSLRISVDRTAPRSNPSCLRGIAGSGKAILRTDEPGLCLTIPIRFVAGDFGGGRHNRSPGRPDPLRDQKQGGRQSVGAWPGCCQRHVQRQRPDGSGCGHRAPIRTGRGLWLCHQPGPQHPWRHLRGQGNACFLPACLAGKPGRRRVSFVCAARPELRGR